MLWRSHPDSAEQFLHDSQEEAIAHYHHYEQLAALSYEKPDTKEDKEQ